MRISNMEKIYLEWYGCNRRKTEFNKLKEYLIKNQYTIVNNPGKADRIFISTCAFKKKEEEDSVKKIKELRTRSKGEIVILGCLPDIAPSVFKNNFPDLAKIAPMELDKIDTIISSEAQSFSDFNSSAEFKMTMIELLVTFVRKIKNIQISDVWKLLLKAFTRLWNILIKHKKISYLNVETGCRGKCSYCGIKYAIGSTKSISLDLLKQELKTKLLYGFNHLIFIADDIGSYGLDMGMVFPDLIDMIINEVNDFTRQRNYRKIYIQLNEIHPKWIINYQNELEDLFKTELIQEILIPIQSGNDRILNIMQREHNAAELHNAIEKLLKVTPDLKINTQIIAGFPSETKSEFIETLNLIKTINFNSVVIFPYHDIENTISSKMTNKNSEEIINERINIAKRYFKKEGIKFYLSCPD